MILEDLAQVWRDQNRARGFPPAPVFTEDYIELEPGIVFSYATTTYAGNPTIGYPDGEDYALARLAIAYGRPIHKRALHALSAAMYDWMRDDRVLAHIRLAHAGLGKFDDPVAASYRLFLADYLFDEGEVSPGSLLKALDLEPLSEDTRRNVHVENFDPDQPRVPGGSGPESGR